MPVKAVAPAEKVCKIKKVDSISLGAGATAASDPGPSLNNRIRPAISIAKKTNRNR
jgi:hypothetical protein